MSAPNIVTVTNILGKTAVQLITTAATEIVENTLSSGKVVKINTLYVGNVNGSSAASLTVDLYRSGTAYRISSTLSVPANSTLDVLSKAIYLEEGDSLRLTSSIDSYLEAVCSYEEIS